MVIYKPVMAFLPAVNCATIHFRPVRDRVLDPERGSLNLFIGAPCFAGVRKESDDEASGDDECGTHRLA
jgi:hypothetical protein